MEKFLKLTNSVYKILEFLPESDPLKNRAKDKALSIMDNLVLINEASGWASFQKEKIKTQLLEDIDIILGYLWIAKSQGWVNSVNCLIISNEYEKIKKEIKPTIELVQKISNDDLRILQKNADLSSEPLEESTQMTPEPVLNSEGGHKRDAPYSFNISDRQIKIIEFLDKNEKAQVMDLQKVLPNITKRTIRRDLDELLEAGKIARLGEFNQVFYRLLKRAS